MPLPGGWARGPPHSHTPRVGSTLATSSTTFLFPAFWGAWVTGIRPCPGTSYDLQPTPFHAHATPIARFHTPQSLFRTISGIQVLLPSTTPYPLWGPRSLISSRSGSYPCPAGAAASLLEGGGVSLLFRPRLLYPAGMSGAGVEVG